MTDGSINNDAFCIEYFNSAISYKLFWIITHPQNLALHPTSEIPSHQAVHLSSTQTGPPLSRSRNSRARRRLSIYHTLPPLWPARDCVKWRDGGSQHSPGSPSPSPLSALRCTDTWTRRYQCPADPQCSSAQHSANGYLKSATPYFHSIHETSKHLITSLFLHVNVSYSASFTIDIFFFQTIHPHILSDPDYHPLLTTAALPLQLKETPLNRIHPQWALRSRSMIPFPLSFI